MRRRYGTGSLFRRGRTWWIAYHAEGRLVRKTARTEVRREAEAFLRAELSAADRGAPATSRATLATLERLVLDDYAANGRRTAPSVRAAFRHLASHFGVDRLAREIRTADVERYKAAKLGAGAAAGTVNLHLAILRRGFRLAVRHGVLAVRPEFALLRLDNARRGFFEEDAFTRVLANVPAWLKLPLRFMYITGWRRSEALGLTWRNVDRAHQVIRIETSKNDQPRTLPYGALPALTAVVAEAYRSRRGPLVFHREDGSPVGSFPAEWRAATEIAGVPGRIVHDFRRTAVRNMERAGVPRSVAMAITGHKTESIYKRYAIVAERDIAEGLAKLKH